MYGKNRSFQLGWLKKYPGLIYSPLLQGGLCMYCILFSTRRSQLGPLVQSPFKQFHKAKEKLDGHFTGNKAHNEAVSQAMEFTAVMENKKDPINRQLNKEVAIRVAKNRIILKSIVETVIFCARQNIPLRGHRDDAKFLAKGHGNSGNFQALLNFRVEAGDKVLEEHFKTANRTCTYRSKTIQNELIKLCGDQLRKKLLAEIQEAVFFTISADEVADAANKEQMSVVVRFVDESNQIREEFMGFVTCEEGTDGETLSNAILKLVQNDWGLSMDNCRGQAYDGAGNMAGKMKGVANRIIQEYPKATYTHCSSHILNLCVVKGLSLRVIQNMMNLADSIARFFNNSPKRQTGLTSAIEKCYTGQRRTKLKEMCRTRWVERHDAFEVFKQLYVPIVCCLQLMCGDDAQNWNQDTRKDANSMLLGITQFSFVITLVSTHHVMAYSKALCVGLQGRAIDIVRAHKCVDLVQKSLQNVRDKIDDFSATWYEEACKLAEDVDVMPSIPRNAGRMQHRANTPASTFEEYYKRNVTIPLLDHLLTELNLRFSEHAKRATEALKLIPSVMEFSGHAESNGTKELIDFYQDDLPSPETVDTEIHIWRMKWDKVKVPDRPDTASKALEQADSLVFPNIHRLLRILCTLPVTSCECERSISGLRRLKTYMRTTMTEDRMNGLLLTHIHYDMELNTDDIIDEFARQHPRRMELLDILQ